MREYKRTFQVITDDAGDGPGNVAAYVPTVLWEAYNTGQEVDLLARLKKKSARQTNANGDGFFWEVVCEYNTEPIAQGQTDSGSPPSGDPAQPQQQSPPDRNPVVEFGSEKSTKLLVKDVITNDDVVASNGQPFDPAVEVPTCYPTFTISLFKLPGADSFANVAHYTNSINSGVFLGFPAKRVLCTEYQLTTQWEQGAWFWSKKVSFKVHPDTTWNPVKILDAGTYEVRGSMGDPGNPMRYQPILDNTGNPITSPVPLDGFGHKLAFGQPLKYRDYNGYREVNWAGIL